MLTTFGLGLAIEQAASWQSVVTEAAKAAAKIVILEQLGAVNAAKWFEDKLDFLSVQVCWAWPYFSPPALLRRAPINRLANNSAPSPNNCADGRQATTFGPAAALSISSHIREHGMFFGRVFDAARARERRRG